MRLALLSPLLLNNLININLSANIQNKESQDFCFPINTEKVIKNDRNFNIINYILNPDTLKAKIIKKSLLKEFKISDFTNETKDFLKMCNSYLRQQVPESINNIRNEFDKKANNYFKDFGTVTKVLSKNKKFSIKIDEYFSTLDFSYQLKIKNFFGQIALIYSPEVLNKSVGQIFYGDVPELSGNPYGFASITEKLDMTYIALLGKDNFDKKIIMDSYNNGINATNEVIQVLVHEYGHILSLYSSLNKEQIKSLNKNNPPLSENVRIGYPNSINEQNLGANHFFNWIKKTMKISNPLHQILFTWLLAPNKYGVYADERKEFRFDEYFAEAFQFWLLTPSEKRDYGWKILNDYFSIEFRNLLLNQTIN